MKTIKDFIEAGNIEGKLVKAVIRQVGCWEYFKEVAENVTNHGAAGGFCGFTYYGDTIDFTKRNRPKTLGQTTFFQ